MDDIRSLETPRDVRNGLKGKVAAALRLVEHDHPCAAANVMRSFIQYVRALERSRRLSHEEASALISQAEEIIALLREEGGCRR